MKRLSLLLLCLLLAACSAPPSPAPIPTPQQINVALLPSLRPLEEMLHICALANPELALLVEEKPATSLTVGQADLVLWLGEPAERGLFAAPLGWEEIVTIVHPENPLSSVSEADLKALLTGQTTQWEESSGESQTVNVWVYPDGNEVQEVIHTALFDGRPVTSLAQLAPNPAAMLEAIASDAGAIGFLPRAWLNDQVKQLQIENPAGLSMRKPVLALSPQEPAGAAREFLLCLQSPLGQGILAEHYEPWS